MNYDEFGFFNQQLAGMLKSGIPLEGALRQLCVGMKQGRLREELQKLESDLAKGIPLGKALAARDLPEFYVRMVLVGTKGNDLPAMLTLLADYYQRANSISARLKGLLVYPMIVLTASFLVSVFLALVYSGYIAGIGMSFKEVVQSLGTAQAITFSFSFFGLWIAPVLLASFLILALWAINSAKVHESLRWRLPGFKEANLSQFAGSLALMLKKGGSLNDSLAILRGLENNSPLAVELKQWETRIATGHQKFSDVAVNSKILPPLFVWMVASSGENWANGFARVSELYYARAIHRIETMLYAVLPISVLALGILILGQFIPLAQMFASVMNALDSMD